MSDEIQEIIELISRLNPEQKRIVLATLRGAVTIAECEGDDSE